MLTQPAIERLRKDTSSLSETAKTLWSGAFHELVDRQALRTPEAPAVISPDATLTYRELVERANRLAYRLIKDGAGPESLVGLCVNRSAQMLVGILGILKAGGAYVSLDPAYPRDRLTYMVTDSRARFIVAEESTKSIFAAEQTQVILLEADDEEEYPQTAPSLTVKPENLAYVIYTSGSTGKPKGVMIEHKSLAAFACWTQERHPGDQSAYVLGCSSLSFDVSVYEYCAALSNGGALVILRNALDLLLKPPHVPISLFITLPSPLAELVRARAIPPSVTTIVTGGEILSSQLANEVYRTTNVTTLINAWGITEDTVVTTDFVVPRVSAQAPPIGSPISHREIRLLDANLQPVPIGTPGELCCTGIGVGRGYLNRPELSAERFVKNPFGDSERMYRSGDLAVADEHGAIRFLGRNDQQIKMNGYRIELGEIEAALAAHPMIAQVAVIAKKISDNTTLAMYAVERRKGTLSLPNIERFLSTRLPKHMIPTTLTVLEKMPLGPSGKTDRKALQSLVRERPALSTRYEAPRDAVEERIAAVFAQLLDMDKVGIHDNFSALGGQSLLATRAIAEIAGLFPAENQALEERQGARALLSAFWQHPSVACISAALQNTSFERAATSPTEDMRCLQQGVATNTPIFLLHGVLDGEAFYPWNIAEALGPDQPLYTLPPHGHSGKPVPQTIETMAAEYLAKIREVQAHGPYRLGGYCNGALVCFEMARMLEREGETVEKLVLLGAPGHNIAFGRLEAMIASLHRLPGFTSTMRRRAFLRIRGQMLRFKKLFAKSQTLTPAVEQDAFQAALHAAHLLAIDAYVPKSYGGSATLIFGEDDEYLHQHHPFRAWAKVIPNLVTVKVLGEHHFVEERPELITQYL